LAQEIAGGNGCLEEFCTDGLQGGCEIGQMTYPQFAVCSLQFAVCSLQFAVCSLQFAVCSLQFIWSIRSGAGFVGDLFEDFLLTEVVLERR